MQFLRAPRRAGVFLNISAKLGISRHRWLGLTHPDPTGVHFEAILEACDALCERYDVDPRRLYLWVDYVSVPQKNKVLQRLSIGSITVYASVCRYFLVVAPATTNADTGVKCDSSTYVRRAESPPMNRGDAAAPTSVETSRGDAAAATWMFL